MSDFANKVVYAGDTPLLNLFKDGAVVVLHSKASGKTIRVKPDGEVDGEGDEGSSAQFFVHVREEGVVALQNVEHPANFLQIKDDNLDLGNGGPYCEFKIEEHDEAVTFESERSPGQRIGIRTNGEVMKPSEITGQGQEGQFVPKVMGERDELIVPGKTPLLMKFGHGNIITLESKATGKHLRIHPNGSVDGNGGDGKWAKFIVHVCGGSKVAFQNVNNPDHWLSIRNKELGNRKGGKFTEFKIEEHGGFAVFKSVACPGLRVGIKPNGKAKSPKHTGTGDHARFSPEVIKEQPQYNRVGDSAIMRTLTHLNTVVLYSKASGKTIRIKPDGDADGEGREGNWAQLIVHVVRPGVVTLQSVRSPKLYLKPKCKLTTGGGGKGCQLKVHEVGDFLVFESVVHRGEHVGIQHNGNPRPPNNTGQGQHARFTPKVKDRSPLLLSLAGRSKLKRLFIDFDKILLESDASEMFLSIKDGKVEGTGGTDPEQLAQSQFVVFVRSSGVVSLQNVNDPSVFIDITDDELVAGNGNVNSQFIVNEVDDMYVALESQIFEKLCVGIADDGSPEKPSITGKGKHGWFTPQPY